MKPIGSIIETRPGDFWLQIHGHLNNNNKTKIIKKIKNNVKTLQISTFCASKPHYITSVSVGPSFEIFWFFRLELISICSKIKLNIEKIRQNTHSLSNKLSGNASTTRASVIGYSY